MCTLFQNIVQIRCRQCGNIIQAHLLQTLQYGFAYAFDGKQGLGFFISLRLIALSLTLSRGERG